jgi:hypothetical protein
VVEKWILRVLVAAMLAIGVWGVIGSVDDIKRYVKIRQM